MKVVIFGGSGQLGHDVVEVAPKNVTLITPTRQQVNVCIKNDLIKFAKDVGQVDIVFYLAGYVKVDLAETEVQQAFDVNTFGVKNVLECFLNVPILYISTDYVFDGKKNNEPYYEDDIVNPINIYGISKLAGEMIVKSYVDKFYIIRTASLFGKIPSLGKGTNFVYTILNKLKKNEEIKVVNDIFMSPTYTYDLAKSIWEIVIQKYPFGIYHVTNSGFCSWCEFAKYIAELAGFESTKILPVSSTEYPIKAKRPKWSVLGSKNYKSIRSWKEALEEFIHKIEY